MNVWMIVGLVVTIAMILGLSIYSGTKFKAGGSKNGSAITAGIIMGTLVGGLIVAVGMVLNTRAEAKEAKLLGDAHQS